MIAAYGTILVFTLTGAILGSIFGYREIKNEHSEPEKLKLVA